VSELTTSRLSGLLRWIGGVLVILLGFELLAVLMANAWGEEAFHQLLVDTLLAHAPMALVGLLLMLVGSRLDFPAQGRSPLRWTVLVVGALMSLALFVAIPVQVGGNQLIQLEANRSVDQSARNSSKRSRRARIPS